MIDLGYINHIFFNINKFTEYQHYRAAIIIANEVTV